MPAAAKRILSLDVDTKGREKSNEKYHLILNLYSKRVPGHNHHTPPTKSRTILMAGTEVMTATQFTYLLKIVVWIKFQPFNQF